MINHLYGVSSPRDETSGAVSYKKVKSQRSNLKRVLEHFSRTYEQGH